MINFPTITFKNSFLRLKYMVWCKLFPRKLEEDIKDFFLNLFKLKNLTNKNLEKNMYKKGTFKDTYFPRR